MVLKVIALFNIFILAACTTNELGRSSQLSIAETTPAQNAVQKDLSQTAHTDISPDVLFLLLTAEIAGQREQYELALDGYLKASEQVKDVNVILRAAKIALYVQDDAKLKQAIDLWVEADPDSLDARYLTAIAGLRVGDREMAFSNTEMVLLKSPGDFDVKAIAMIKHLPKPQSVALAYQVFADLSKKYPDNYRLYFILALLDAQTQKVRSAQVSVALALDIEPQWSKALLLQAQLYISQGKLAAATDVLQKIGGHEDSVQIKEQIVQLLMQQGRFEEAETDLVDLIDSYPNNRELKFKLALVYLQLGEEPQSRHILQELVLDIQFRDRASFYLGRMDTKAKHYEKALVWFDAISAGPYKFEAGMSAILILVEQKRYKNALSKLEQLKADYPEKVSGMVLLESEIYSHQQAYQQGFDVLTQALLENPKNEKVLYARALMAEKIGKLDVLEDDLKYILELKPNDANALNALGYTLVDQTTRFVEAQVYLEKAMVLKPNEPIFMDSYGWLLFKLNRFEEAKKYLQRAYDLQPQAEIAAHLVSVLSALGEDRSARELLVDALKKSPEDPLLLELEQRLLGNS